MEDPAYYLRYLLALSTVHLTLDNQTAEFMTVPAARPDTQRAPLHRLPPPTHRSVTSPLIRDTFLSIDLIDFAASVAVPSRFNTSTSGNQLSLEVRTGPRTRSNSQPHT